ncbi:hypothetical protein [Simiduia aestuariiviva]|uniref:MORN repeat-containing protein n=1 Tax=Simiduia aestuariiviva TaxID=1510459 RepID=A0A839URJ5_9GAMM|nr:hypothetical protein [Simiduia aestuariiviva]MBB3168027.1 hypothetical protein [Simiduia aestuariiviva]
MQARKIMAFVFLAFTPLAVPKVIAAVDPLQGRFVESWEVVTNARHGIPNRDYLVASAPNTTSLQQGWNDQHDNKKKHGLQYYVANQNTSVEYFWQGERQSTASYRNGKPDGWFSVFQQGKKHGLQHYFSGATLSVEGYEHGQRRWAGNWEQGHPGGWFNHFVDNKKHGRQIYVGDRNDWSFEDYVNGQKHGWSGAMKGDVRDGWFYRFHLGKQVERAYYVLGVLKNQEVLAANGQWHSSQAGSSTIDDALIWGATTAGERTNVESSRRVGFSNIAVPTLPVVPGVMAQPTTKPVPSDATLPETNLQPMRFSEMCDFPHGVVSCKRIRLGQQPEQSGGD